MYVIRKEGAGGSAESVRDEERLVGIERFQIPDRKAATAIDIAADVDELRIIP